MGTTLDHGIYLPDEGERNCYDGLAGNWVALDNHLGSTDIHVTINDKQAWNGHVADTTIHVTSADKQAWNGHVADSVKHVTAEDKAKWDAVTSKADDSDVVHKSGNETVGGQKTFSSDITLQGTTTPVIKTISNIIQDTSAYNGSVSWVIRAKDNLNNILESALYKYSSKNIDWQLKLTGIDNGVSSTKGIRFTLDPVNNVANFIPIGNNSTSLGNSSTKWKDVNTYLVNGLTPSSLSLPDLNNAVDISGYITDLAGNPNAYSPPANGYIVLRSTTANVLGLVENTTGMGSYSRGSNQVLAVNLPVAKNSSISIYAICSSLTHAKFIPCRGNV